MITINAFIAGALLVDAGIQWLIVDRLFRARQRHKPEEEVEEENLTRYESHTSPDQPKGWEFKIVRTHSGGFRDRRVLQKVCAQEANTGWILLEKLDDRRLRFRRPVTARERDHLSKVDPYRTYYGIPEDVETFIGVFVFLAVMGVTAFVGFKAMESFFTTLQTRPIPTLKSPNARPEAPR